MGNHKSCPRPDDYYKCKRNRCCLRPGHTGPPELPGISGGQEDQMGIVKRAAELLGTGDFGLYVVFAVLILLLVMVAAVGYMRIQRVEADVENVVKGGGVDGEGKSGGKVVEGGGKSEVSI